MNLDQITPQGFILALFIRDDGERFLLGSGAYQFKQDQLHFIANTYQNDIVEVQGNDGLLLAGQVRRAVAQAFDGYIGDSTVARTDIEQYRQDFLAFFRKNFFYTVVYIFNDGSAIQRRQGFIVDAPEVKELYQLFPEYHIALNFEDINYYSYEEDENGDEAYTKSAEIALTLGVQNGGLIWDATGVEWDNEGAEWEAATSGGSTTVQVNSIDAVYPVWEVVGPAHNPILSNLTTNTALTYNGTVASGQTLTVDMFKKTAFLNTTSVVSDLSGDWVYFMPGNNSTIYTTNSNTDTPTSTIYWQEVVG